MSPRRVALVTGASSGIGLRAAVALARDGVRVFAGMRDVSRAADLIDAATQARVTVEPVAIDVRDEAAVREVVARLERDAGRLDVVVNSAGVLWSGFAEDTSADELREQFETNFFGVANVCRAVIPGMRSRWYGRILNVSSLGGRVASPMFSGYDASKFAVEGYSEALRHELRAAGVFVSLIEPGMVPTRMVRHAWRRSDASADPQGANAVATARLERLFQVGAGWSHQTTSADAVARVIARAASARTPRLRYVVGLDAYATLWLSRAAPQAWELWNAWLARPETR